MTELEREFLRRNARLRAWASRGVPTQGWAWELYDATLHLTIGCGICGKSQYFGRTGDPDRLDEYEWAGVVFSKNRWGCPHLAPLLGPDPEDLAPLVALELLAGAPP